MSDITKRDQPNAGGIFDEIRRVNGAGVEYWMARDLQQYLGYDTWQNFDNAIKRAMEACEGSGIQPSHQFSETTRLMASGKGAQREAKDYFLSRYACYLIAMNAEPSKAKVALAQSYFAVQTRRQEIADATTEDEKRLEIRERVRESSTALNSTASRAGVTHFPFFHDAGYRGMYNAGQGAVKKMKGIKPNEDFLDCIGPLELAANEFRIRLTEEKLRVGQLKGQRAAEDTHRDVGRKVRKTVDEEIGRPPERLPRAESIKQIERRKRKGLKDK
ncbi:MAG: DNA damage-inducible protein D [Acidobacteriota bacterium]